MALEVMKALNSTEPKEIVADVRNGSAILDFAADDVVEVICNFSSAGAVPLHSGRLPESVRGLAVAMKAYERAVIVAALDRSPASAEMCLLMHPAIADWDAAKRLVAAMHA